MHFNRAPAGELEQQLFRAREELCRRRPPSQQATLQEVGNPASQTQKLTMSRCVFPSRPPRALLATRRGKAKGQIP